MQNLTIDPEFQNLIPKLTTDEYNLLEESILADGCKVAIDFWIDTDCPPESCRDFGCSEGFTLTFLEEDYFWVCDVCGFVERTESCIIDGHNRYEICQKHGIDFDTNEVEIDNRDNVKRWIIKTQRARRNLSLYDLGVLVLKDKEILAKQAKENQTLSQGRGIKGLVTLPNLKINTREQLADEAGMSGRTLDKIEKIHKESTPEIIQSIRDGELTINKAYTQIVNEERNEKEKQLKESLEAVPLPNKIYDVVVIDPPWDMQKILRDVAPNQKEFDYPTMTIDEIKAFPIKDLVADNCHVFLWTTQKYLPSAFDIIKEWGLTYVLTMVWHKNGGFQPFGLPQYNCEFVLYAHKGNPKFIDTKAFNCCFNGERGKHSEKPNEFYQLLDRVCDGNKIDIFARKEREGWSVYGNEVI